MKVIAGDLISLAKKGYFDVIIHGCNCFCTMGTGIAKSIKLEFPDAYQADLCTKKGSISKIGTYSFSKIPLINSKNLIVINAYTQFNYGKDILNISYEAIKQVFRKIKIDFTGKRIGYPIIGAGLAGGDWNIIYGIICEQLENEDHTFVKFVE